MDFGELSRKKVYQRPKLVAIRYKMMLLSSNWGRKKNDTDAVNLRVDLYSHYFNDLCT